MHYKPPIAPSPLEPEMKSLLIISRHPPAQHSAREALDMTLAAAAFGVPCAILFMDNGVFQLLKGQDSAQIKQKSVASNLQALSMFGVEEILVCERSLHDRGMAIDACTPAPQALTSVEISELLSRYDQIVTL